MDIGIRRKNLNDWRARGIYKFQSVEDIDMDKEEHEIISDE